MENFLGLSFLLVLEEPCESLVPLRVYYNNYHIASPLFDVLHFESACTVHNERVLY